MTSASQLRQTARDTAYVAGGILSRVWQVIKRKMFIIFTGTLRRSDRADTLQHNANSKYVPRQRLGVIAFQGPYNIGINSVLLRTLLDFRATGKVISSLMNI